MKIKFIAFFVLIAFLFSCSNYGERGAVSSVEFNATNAGILMLKKGGNAFDAAVAIAFALAVTHPQAGNIGGGGFIVMRLNSGQVHTIDFRETAPQNAQKDMYLDSHGDVDRDKALLGPLAAGVPGTVAGLWVLHQKYGKLSWNICLIPAIELAEKGFHVDSSLSADLQKYQPLMSHFISTRQVYYPHEHCPEKGELFVQHDLANVLMEIAKLGRDGFYKGWVADKIAEYMKANNGIITKSDLENYQPLWRDPGEITFLGYKIYTMRLPSSAYIVLKQILKSLEPYLKKTRYNINSTAYIRLLAEAEKRAFADRNFYLADPGFIRMAVDSLVSNRYIRHRFNGINETVTSPEKLTHGNPFAGESRETTHFSVVDKEGNAVSCTYTLNGNFGSKAVVAGTGVLLNNEMDDFSAKPGEPNMFGLKMGTANAIEPGKRMLSSMSPTIVTKNGSLFFITGSPGGSTILTTVLQTILNTCYFNYDLTKSITLPRFHHQDYPDSLKLEYTFRKNTEEIKELNQLGYHISWRKRLGDVNAIMIKNNKIQAIADPRVGGGALVF